MTCACRERDQTDTARTHNASTLPTEPCLFCAEKHLTAAAALAREQGYSGVNRGFVVGELVAACWHLFGHPDPEARALSDKLRELRHDIQSRKQDESAADWESLFAEIDRLIAKEEKA